MLSQFHVLQARALLGAGAAGPQGSARVLLDAAEQSELWCRGGQEQPGRQLVCGVTLVSHRCHIGVTQPCSAGTRGCDILVPVRGRRRLALLCIAQLVQCESARLKVV